MTLKHAKLIQTTGKMLRVIVPPGDGQWKKESKKPTWNVTGKLKRSAIAAKTAPLCPPSASSASCAVGTAARALATLQHQHGLLRVHKLFFSRLDPPFTSIWPLVTNSYSFCLSLTTITMMIMTIIIIMVMVTNDQELEKKTNTNEPIQKSKRLFH